MGQKIHPNAMRIGVNKSWKAAWYANGKGYADKLLEDIKIRAYLQKKLDNAGLEQVVIKKYANHNEIMVKVARPGVVIGRGGAGIEEIKKELSRKLGSATEIKIFEVKNPETSAMLIADNVAKQLERRIVPKFACQRAIEAAKNSQAISGVRIWVSGRIKGAEIARTEKFQWGTVPLQTIRADIDYAYLTALVPNAGKHGIKVWVYRGEKHGYDLNE